MADTRRKRTGVEQGVGGQVVVAQLVVAGLVQGKGGVGKGVGGGQVGLQPGLLQRLEFSIAQSASLLA